MIVFHSFLLFSIFLLYSLHLITFSPHFCIKFSSYYRFNSYFLILHPLLCIFSNVFSIPLPTYIPIILHFIFSILTLPSVYFCIYLFILLFYFSSYPPINIPPLALPFTLLLLAYSHMYPLGSLSLIFLHFLSYTHVSDKTITSHFKLIQKSFSLSSNPATFQKVSTPSFFFLLYSSFFPLSITLPPPFSPPCLSLLPLSLSLSLPSFFLTIPLYSNNCYVFLSCLHFIFPLPLFSFNSARPL